MKKEAVVKLFALILAVLAVANFLAVIFGKISMLSFWITIIITAVAAWLVVPWAKKKA